MAGTRNEGSKSTVQIGRRRSDETLRQIVALIFEGHLSPGSPLPPERALAETLRVSRPTLREALNKLEAKGLIERRSKSGNYVCTAIPNATRDPIEDVVASDRDGIAQGVEIRKVLELWAVGKAAETPSKACLKALRKCLADMKAGADFRTPEEFAKYREADLRFHQILARMTRNSIYVHLFHFFSHLVSRSMVVSRLVAPGDFAAKNNRLHHEVYAAVRAGDSAAARQAMLDHFTLVEKYLSPKKPRKKDK